MLNFKNGFQSLFHLLRLHLIGASCIIVSIYFRFNVAKNSCYCEGENEVDHSDNGKGLEVLVVLCCDCIS